MPLINTFDSNKFHAITTRISSKQRFSKQTSAETLKTIVTNQTPTATTSEQKSVTDVNLTRRNSSVLKLDSFMQTKSGDNIYLSSSINPKIGPEIKTNADISPSIALQTSTEKIYGLKAMHQHLVNLYRNKEPDKPMYKPRTPTLERIKRAVEKAHKEKIERHKCIGTDIVMSGLSAPDVANAVTSTKSKPKKGTKKVRELKTTTTNGVIRTKKKKKKAASKSKISSTRQKE